MAEKEKPVILNVDDDDAGRYYISKVLSDAGFHVSEARTGAEAFDYARREPDLILLDVHLPNGSGFDVAQRLKADPETRDIPIIHISATAVSAEDRTKGLDQGADAYITQPVAPEVLVATVKALLRARKAESEARRAAREWQQTFDAVKSGVCLLDREGRVLRANRALAEMFGTTPEELAGAPYTRILPDVQPPADGWPFERTRKTRQRETAEIQTGDRWLEITADPLIEHGEFAGAVRTAADVTDRRRYARDRDSLVRALEDERVRLETVLDQMPAGMILADAPSGRLLLANEQVARILRRPSGLEKGVEVLSELKGYHADGREYHPDDWPLTRSIRTGEVITNEEIEIARGDKTRGWILVSAAPVRDRSGFIVAGILTFQDITERKHLEEQLRQSQKMEAVGRLAGGVAHDFNNLLTIIGGYGQMLLDATDPADAVYKDLEAIMEAANRASALTRQLLTVSRRQVVQPKTFELNRLISRMNRMLRRVIGEDVELVNALKSDRGRIKADPGQIEQVLLNLAVNARDAMPKGGRLTIETADIEIGRDAVAEGQALKAGRYVLLAVNDTGTGMTPDVMKHMFEPFFTTKPKGRGTGLGLSTVYGIVKQTGGEIEFDSEPGIGTTFRIYFPAAATRGREADTEREAPAEEPSHGGTETILLVEDEADVRRLAAEMLTRQGYAVLEAASGPDAIKLWEENRDAVKLVVTDIVMPRMSGQELAATLKAARPDLKIMFMSGYTEDVVARHGGIERAMLLHKPFTSDTLARTVRAVLDGR